MAMLRTSKLPSGDGDRAHSGMRTRSHETAASTTSEGLFMVEADYTLHIVVSLRTKFWVSCRSVDPSKASLCCFPSLAVSSYSFRVSGIPGPWDMLV